MQTVKDWLTPSKWINPWEEENEQEQEDVGMHTERPSRDEPIKPSSNQPPLVNNDVIISSSGEDHQLPHTTVHVSLLVMLSWPILIAVHVYVQYYMSYHISCNY